MSKHVFVSHSHQDLPAAELMVKALEARGVTCWIAPRDVPPGGSYAEAILNAIEGASCFVLIYSEHCNVSSHVLREVERALKFNLNIVPVRFDDSMPSKSLDYLLATVHWLSIAADARDRSIMRAVEQIAACVANPEITPALAPPSTAAPTPIPPPQTAAAPVTPPPKPKLWILIPVLLVIGALIWFLASRNSAPSRRTKPNETAASPAASSSKNATVSATPQPQTEAPLAVAHQYVAFLAKRNATGAYNLLSESFRRRVSIARFSKTVGSKPAVKLVKGTIASQTGNFTSLEAIFEDTDPAAHENRWKAPINFVLESGAWRIDSMKGLFPASVRPIHGSANEFDDEPTSPTPAPSPTPTPTAKPQMMLGIVHSPPGGAALHEQPSAQSKVLFPLNDGDRLQIDKIEGDFLHATLSPGKEGWVHKNRVKINPKE